MIRRAAERDMRHGHRRNTRKATGFGSAAWNHRRVAANRARKAAQGRPAVAVKVTEAPERDRFGLTQPDPGAATVAECWGC